MHGVMAGHAGIEFAAADLVSKFTVEVTKSISHCCRFVLRPR